MGLSLPLPQTERARNLAGGPVKFTFGGTKPPAGGFLRLDSPIRPGYRLRVDRKK